MKGQLTIIMVESQGLSLEEADAFALKNNWLLSDLLWTTERPFQTGAKGIPNCVLLSNDGEVLFKGSPLSGKKTLEEAIKEQLNRIKKGPREAPKAVRKAWVDFGKNKYGAAIAALDKVAQAGRDDAEAARDAMERVHQRIQLRIDRVGRMIEEGYLLEAQDRVDTLASACKGLEDFEPKVDALKDNLASPEMKPEIKAAESLAKLKKKIASNGVDGSTKKALAKFAEKHAGTKAADFARRLIRLADA